MGEALSGKVSIPGDCEDFVWVRRCQEKCPYLRRVEGTVRILCG